MNSPEQVAADIVNRFSWTANVMAKGMLVSQQVVVAKAIAEAIERERAIAISEREAREKSEAALRQKDAAMGVLFDRMRAANVDFSDLIP